LRTDNDRNLLFMQIMHKYYSTEQVNNNIVILILFNSNEAFLRNG